MIYSYGDEYEGEWQDDVFCGEGVYYFQDGDIWRGEWIDNCLNGKATKFRFAGNDADGHVRYDVYEGTAQSDKFTGRVTVTYAATGDVEEISAEQAEEVFK